MKKVVHLSGEWHEDERHSSLLLSLVLSQSVSAITIDKADDANASSALKPFIPALSISAGGSDPPALIIKNDSLVTPGSLAAILAGTVNAIEIQADALTHATYEANRTRYAQQKSENSGEVIVFSPPSLHLPPTAVPLTRHHEKQRGLVLYFDGNGVWAVGNDGCGRSCIENLGSEPAGFVRKGLVGGYIPTEPLKEGAEYVRSLLAIDAYRAAIAKNRRGLGVALNSHWELERAAETRSSVLSATDHAYAKLRSLGAYGGRPTTDGIFYVSEKELKGV